METLYTVIEYLFPHYANIKNKLKLYEVENKRLNSLLSTYKRDFINLKQEYNLLCEKYEFVVRDIQNIS